MSNEEYIVSMFISNPKQREVIYRTNTLDAAETFISKAYDYLGRLGFGQIQKDNIVTEYENNKIVKTFTVV